MVKRKMSTELDEQLKRIQDRANKIKEERKQKQQAKEKKSQDKLVA
jgi:hypothetical protein